MLLTTTAKKKTRFAGIRVYPRRIAGFTEQRNALMIAQSAILQGEDFILHVERALNITSRLIHEENISKLKSWSGDPTFLMQKRIFNVKSGKQVHIVKKNVELNFSFLKFPVFKFKQDP